MKKMIFFVKLFSFLIFGFILILSGFYVYAYITPNIDLKNINQIEMYDSNNNIFYSSSDNNNWIPLENISENVITAMISVEDKNFYKHQGFDYPRIIKAMLTNIKDRSLNQGASTISQQYIKNLYLSFDKTWERKIEEAFLTFELEVHNSKEEILEGYLNTINYGGVYGIESASKYYFNKSAKDLSLAEASIIVGIPKNPSLYNPITNYKSSKERQLTVLNSMVKNNYISKEEKDKVYGEKLNFYGKNNKEKLESVSYYKDAVLNELTKLKEIPKSLVETGGIKIFTNLDVTAQEKLETAVNENMNENSDLQVGAIAVEPSSGKVLAVIGGYDYNKSQYNRVIQAKRQVGSTLKPFLYYAALENGFTASSTFTSEKTVFNLGNGKTYSPQNSGNVYANNKISLAAALAYSDNVYAVKTHLFLGENTLVNLAKRVGIKESLSPDASLPLGTNEINMLDYSNGYSTLANGGIKNKSYFITKITDMDNNVLYEYKYQEELVLNSKLVYILNELMRNIYNYNFVDYNSPTMLSMNNLLTKKYAIKTGSTEFDSWTIGYNKDVLLMVWNGTDNNRNLTWEESKINKTIWAKTIESILKDKKDNWYEIPNGITAALVNPVSGELTDSSKTALLYYVKGTEPTLGINPFNNLYLGN